MGKIRREEKEKKIRKKRGKREDKIKKRKDKKNTVEYQGDTQVGKGGSPSPPKTCNTFKFETE